MSWFVSAIIAGITSFVATNIDDILILMIFFTQVNSTLRRRHIVVGQYLGFIAILLASLPGFLGGLILPKPWIGLLGLVPIGIGISHLLNREKDEEVIQVVSEQFNPSTAKGSLGAILASLVNPQTFNVAAVTFANGGDNIGIYVSLFASINLASLGVILGVFFLLIGVWCYLAYRLSRQPAIAQILARYGHAIVPFVLIGLGIFILVESGSYTLFKTIIFFN
ncbi:MAG TPA: transporter [Cyanobacteria bacterium UBA11162]|nr:transporter [Cyanobacteria bacterium UBA11162]